MVFREDGALADRIRSEYTCLSDIYHALGACTIAVVLAYGAYLAYNVAEYHAAIAAHPGNAVASLVLVSLASVAVFHIFSRARGRTAQTLEDMIVDGLRHLARIGEPTPDPSVRAKPAQ
jgi:hypothetical protein